MKIKGTMKLHAGRRYWLFNNEGRVVAEDCTIRDLLTWIEGYGGRRVDIKLNGFSVRLYILREEDWWSGLTWVSKKENLLKAIDQVIIAYLEDCQEEEYGGWSYMESQDYDPLPIDDEKGNA